MSTDITSTESTVTTPHLHDGIVGDRFWSLYYARRVVVVGVCECGLEGCDSVEIETATDQTAKRSVNDLRYLFVVGQVVSTLPTSAVGEESVLGVVTSLGDNAVTVRTIHNVFHHLRWSDVEGPANPGVVRRIEEGEALAPLLALMATDTEAATRARLAAEAEVQSLKDTHEAFRRMVARTATRYAIRHEWCSVVDEALSEMDLKRVPTRFRFSVDVTRTETFVISGSNADSAEERLRYLIDGAGDIYTSGQNTDDNLVSHGGESSVTEIEFLGEDDDDE